VINRQLYRGSGRTKSAARRDAVRRALSCSIQRPDGDIISEMVTHNMIDFTSDSYHPSMNAHSESATTEDVRRTSTAWCLPSFLSTVSHCTSTDVATNDALSSRATSSSRRRRSSWFNAAAVLHDVRPSACYKRLTSSNDGAAVHATVTVDERCFEGFGATWRAAKRNAASRALQHILQLSHI